MKKWITSIAILVGLLICSCITCFAASTSESLLEAVAETRGQEKYLETAHAPSDNTTDNDHVDTSTGNIIISETDLYLPGKNGMDVSIKRNFNSFDGNWDYEYLPDKRVNADGNMFMYRYEDDDGDYVWIAYNSEEEFLAADSVIEYKSSSAEKYDFASSDNGNVRGYLYKSLTKTNTDATFTLVTPIVSDECFVTEDGEGLLTHWHRISHVQDMINYNWYFNTPYIDDSSYASNNYYSSGTYYFDDDMFFRFYDGNEQFNFKLNLQYTKTGNEFDISYIKIINLIGSHNFEAREMTDTEQSMLIQKIGEDIPLKLCIVLERDDGMRYFINEPHTGSDILLVADRFGNCIDYSVPGEIVDSMGRRIVYNETGIQLEDSDGNLQYAVKYSASVDENTQSPSFYVNKTYQLTVERFKHLGDTQTDDITVYKMGKHGRPMPSKTWTSYYYTVDSIVYPTGAHRDYTYNNYKIYEPYFGQHTSQGIVFAKSKVTSSKLYSANNADHQYHYEYVFSKSNEGEYYANSRKADMEFTMQKIRKAPNSSDNITTTYTYDYLSRLHSQSSKKGTSIVYPSYTHTYTSGSTSADARPIKTDTTIESGVTKRTEYAYRYASSLPDTTIENGLKVKQDYDAKELSASSFLPDNSGYFLPTTLTYTSTSGNSVLKTVTNTLSEDKKTITETTVSDADGVKEKTAYEYNTDGTVSKMRVYSDITNNVYTETSYTYNYNADGSYSVTTSVSGVKDADGNNSHTVSTTVSYDRFGNIASATDAKGVKTEYTYDLSGRVLSEKLYTDDNILYSEKSYSYDVSGNTVDITRENGRQEKQIFDSYGNLVASQVNYDGGFKNVYTYTYDTFGRPVTSTEISQYNGDSVAEKYVTTNTYDDRNRVVKQTVKNNAGTVVYEVTTTYGSENGNATTLSRMTADTTYATAGYKSVYDAYGRKLSDVILQNTTEYSKTDYTYDLFGNLLTSKDDKARESGAAYSVQYTYDHAGNILTEQDVFGNTTISNTYNNAGWLLSAQEASGKTLSYTYDVLGRAVLVHDGTGYTRNYYDDNGNLVKEITGNSATAASGKYVNYTYDDFNRLIHKFTGTTTAISNITFGLNESYTYDIMGNVLSTSQRDNNTVKTTYTYDILGRNTSVTIPSGGTESYVYNFDGTLKSKTDKNGTVFTYSNYDVFKNAGRIDAVNGDDSQYQTFSYDKMNHLTHEYDSLYDTSVSYDYDFLGRQTMSYGNQFAVVNSAYDTVGNRTSMSIGEWTPMGTIENYNTQTYTYDAKHRMTATTAFGKTTSYSYNTNDYVIGKLQGTTEMQRSYNNRGMVTKDLYGTELGYTSECYYYDKNYSYDCYGEQITESVKSIDHFTNFDFNLSYAYDGASRLINATFGNNGENKTLTKYYGYNINTNMNQVSTSGTDVGAEYYVDFPYTSSNHIKGNVLIDNNGEESNKRITSDANGSRLSDRDAVLTYDLFNRLASYTKNNVTTTYTYYPNGLRESKTVNNVKTQFIWDGGNLVGEKSLDAYTCDRIFAYGADGLEYRKDVNGSIYQYLVNFRGDVIAILDENQNIKAEYVFEPYGEIYRANISDGFVNNFGYRGQYHDAESGYIYLRMRYMDPTTGRFITEDPIRDGLNWFAYCEGNPIRYVDLWGLELILEGTGDEVQAIWQTIKELSHDDLVLTQQRGKDGKLLNKYTVTISSEKEGHCKSGTELVKRLIESDKTVTIKIGTSGNKYLPIGRIIQFDPNYNPNVITTNPETGIIEYKKRPNFIGLAHEMIHAERHIRNVDLTGYVTYKYPVSKTAKKIWLFTTYEKNYFEQEVQKEELATIGLKFNKRGDITENMIRQEHGLWLRGAY